VFPGSFRRGRSVSRFTLPCCGLTVSCFSLYFPGAGISCDFRTWVEPDIVAERSSEDAANDRDPAMEAILREMAARSAGPEPPEVSLASE